MKHALRTPAPAAVTARRHELVEEQLAELSRSHIALTRDLANAQATVRRRDQQLTALWHQLALAGELLRRLLLAYSALARVRDTSRPARVLDTGTPGVEVTR